MEAEINIVHTTDAAVIRGDQTDTKDRTLDHARDQWDEELYNYK